MTANQESLNNFKYQKMNESKNRKIKYIVFFASIIAVLIIIGLVAFSPKGEFITDTTGNYLFRTENVKAFEAKFGIEENVPDMIVSNGDNEIKIKIPQEGVQWEKTEKGIRAISENMIYDYAFYENSKGDPIGIKEQITINEPTTYSSFVFPLDFKNLHPEKINGIWRFYDNKLREKFYIPKPFMVDASGQRSEDVELEINPDNGYIKIVLNEQWLKDKNRKYPIVIDPSLVASGNDGQAVTDLLQGAISDYSSDEYWVYIKDEDEITSPDMIAGRTQKGDIVDIIPVARGNGQYSQSDEYLIIRVRGLTKEQITQFLERYETTRTDQETQEPMIAQTAERRRRIDLDKFKKENNIVFETGTIPFVIDAAKITTLEKTPEEVASYYRRSKFYAKFEWLRKLAREIIPIAWANNVYYVDPDAAAAGDGTTNALEGANCAFQSLSLWEDARDAVLSDVEECIVDSNGASHTVDSTATTLAGWTTSEANYIYIHTPVSNRQAGKWDDTKYRMVVNDAILLNITNVASLYITIEGVQFKRTYTSVQYATAVGTALYSTSVAKFDSCIFVAEGANNGLFFNGDADQTAYAYNSIAYGGGSRAGYSSAAAVNSYCYNCVSTKHTSALGYGFLSFDSCINCVAAGNTGADFSSVGTVDYCASDDGTGTNAQTLNATNNYAAEFVNYTSEDYHLVVGSVAIDNGTPDPGTGLYSDDIDGDARGASWDIGVDEYVAAVGATVESILNLKGGNIKIKGGTLRLK
jgi:hypothetical protein